MQFETQVHAGLPFLEAPKGGSGDHHQKIGKIRPLHLIHEWEILWEILILFLRIEGFEK